MKVYDSTCKNCLLSPDSIVSPQRRKQILQQCAQEQAHFICHKATMDGKDVCCKTFYDTMGQKNQLIQIAQRLGVVEFVEQPDSEKLPTWKEMQGNK